LRGGYALILRVGKEATIMIGRRAFTIDPGVYIYSGSALGPGGVEARVERHLRRFERRDSRKGGAGKGGGYRWHIDCLLPVAESFIAVCAESKRRTECLLTSVLKDKGMQVVKGFGSADCRSGCGGHLLFMLGGDTEAAIRAAVEGYNELGIKPSRL